MTISDKLTAAANNVPLVYEAGKQAEYDRFWDELQQNGERSNYFYGLCGASWTVDTLKPKYKIKPVTVSTNQRFGQNIFYRLGWGTSTPFDATELCKMLDLSECINPVGLFNNAKAKNITVDLSNAADISNAFAAGDGGSLDNVTVTLSDKCTNLTNAFYYYSGTSLTFTEGSVINGDIKFAQSKSLSKESIKSIMNALSDSAAGLSATFMLNTVNNAFETDEGAADGSTSEEWATLTGTKTNWTINLV